MSARPGERLALAVCLMLLVGVTEVGARDGEEVYRERCSACHGPGGRGDGPVAAALSPPPRDFTAPAFWATRTRTALEIVVRDGRPGTPMPGFKDVLSAEEIGAVVGHLEGFRGPSEQGGDAARRHDQVSGTGSGEDAAGPDARP